MSVAIAYGAHLAEHVRKPGDARPVDRRVPKEDAESTIGGQGRVHLAHRIEELPVDRHVPDRSKLRRVLPDLTKLRGGNVSAAHELVHYGLIERIAELDDDVVDRFRESRVAEKRESERMSLLVIVITF